MSDERAKNLKCMSSLSLRCMFIFFGRESLRVVAAVLMSCTIVLSGGKAAGETNARELKEMMEGEDFIAGSGDMPDGLDFITQGMSLSDVVAILVNYHFIKVETISGGNKPETKFINFYYYNGEYGENRESLAASIYFDKDELVRKIRYGLFQ